MLLQTVLGIPVVEEEPWATECRKVMHAYQEAVGLLSEADGPNCHLYTRYELWIKGLEVALTELLESRLAASHFGGLVLKSVLEEMNAEELADYYRYIYFYKNSFIRVFAILDKLGYFLNERLNLQTEREKSRFSYYTVLRRMYKLREHANLEKPLYRLKNRYQVSMSELRKLRNMEIHFINAEMVDDLTHAHLCAGFRTYVENIPENLDHLHHGIQMVCASLTHTCTYLLPLEGDS